MHSNSSVLIFGNTSRGLGTAQETRREVQLHRRAARLGERRLGVSTRSKLRLSFPYVGAGYAVRTAVAADAPEADAADNGWPPLGFASFTIYASLVHSRG